MALPFLHRRSRCDLGIGRRLIELRDKFPFVQRNGRVTVKADLTALVGQLRPELTKSVFQSIGCAAVTLIRPRYTGHEVVFIVDRIVLRDEREILVPPWLVP